jgi:hypothetical protein
MENYGENQLEKGKMQGRPKELQSHEEQYAQPKSSNEEYDYYYNTSL